jgi:hypothetical protein
MVIPGGGLSAVAASLAGKCLQTVPRIGESSRAEVRDCSAERPDSTHSPTLRGRPSVHNP